MRAYIAGPLFDEGERWWIERVEQTVTAAGFTTFLPHRDNPPKDEHNVAAIFANDRRGIDECDVVVASLNGLTTDDGTAWELGYAFALRQADHRIAHGLAPAVRPRGDQPDDRVLVDVADPLARRLAGRVANRVGVENLYAVRPIGQLTPVPPMPQ